MDTDYEEFTVAQLKDFLRERELPVSGKKAELIARLAEDDNTPETEEAPEEEMGEDDGFDDDDDADFFDDEWDDFHVARQKPVLDDGIYIVSKGA